MERAIQCTNCGIITKDKKKMCEFCGEIELIDIVIPQEDDYVFYDRDDEMPDME